MRFTTACENDELQPLKIVHQSAERGPVRICKILIGVLVLDWLDSKGAGSAGWRTIRRTGTGGPNI